MKKILKNPTLTIVMITVIFVILFISLYFIRKGSFGLEEIVFTYNSEGVTANKEDDGYDINNNTVEITYPGIYRVTGENNNGNIVIDKDLDNVILVIDNLTLSSNTYPITIGENTTLKLKVLGESTITETKANETETSLENVGAVIKAKANSTLIIYGDGAITLKGLNQEGISGATGANLDIVGGTINIEAAHEGINYPNLVTVNNGAINITAGKEGIKVYPEATDTTSLGKLVVNYGALTIKSNNDSIKVKNNVTFENGYFDLKTLNGYETENFDKENNSAKGINVTGSTATDRGIFLNSGYYLINTADDAINTDSNIEIKTGEVYIRTLNSGIHANSTLTIGYDNGYARDPMIQVMNSKEGFEAGNVRTYSGKFYINSTDDGINVGGGNGSTSTTFNPDDNNNYTVNLNGGNFLIASNGDGIDSRGAINITKGLITIFSQTEGGDNTPFDSANGTTITGATVFAAGTNPSNLTLTENSQHYFTDTTSREKDSIININLGENVVYSDKLIKKANYILYSSPSMTNNEATITTSESVNNCLSNTMDKGWDETEIVTESTTTSTGIRSYRASACKLTELRTIPKKGSNITVDENITIPERVGYDVNFIKNNRAKVNLFYTDSATEANETDVTTAKSRNARKGYLDNSGSGVVNFQVVIEEGYKIDNISIEGTYGKVTEVENSEITNLYKITNVSSNLTVRISIIKEADNLAINTSGTNIYASIANKTALTYYKLLTALEKNNTEVTVKDTEGNTISGETTPIGNGYKVTIDETEYTIIVYGDVDSNGIVNKNDATALANLLVQNTEATALILAAGDIDHDGKIGINDIMRVVTDNKYIESSEDPESNSDN